MKKSESAGYSFLLGLLYLQAQLRRSAGMKKMSIHADTHRLGWVGESARAHKTDSAAWVVDTTRGGVKESIVKRYLGQ